MGLASHPRTYLGHCGTFSARQTPSLRRFHQLAPACSCESCAGSELPACSSKPTSQRTNSYRTSSGMPASRSVDIRRVILAKYPLPPVTPAYAASGVKRRLLASNFHPIWRTRFQEIHSLSPHGRGLSTRKLGRLLPVSRHRGFEPRNSLPCGGCCQLRYVGLRLPHGFSPSSSVPYGHIVSQPQSHPRSCSAYVRLAIAASVQLFCCAT